LTFVSKQAAPIFSYACANRQSHSFISHACCLEIYFFPPPELFLVTFASTSPTLKYQVTTLYSFGASKKNKQTKLLPIVAVGKHSTSVMMKH